MIGIFIYLAFGWLVMSQGKPFRFAAVATGIGLMFQLFFGHTIAELLPTGLITFLLYSALYWLIDRFADEIFRPIGILFAGGVLLGAIVFTL